MGAQHDSLPMVRLLVEAGADPDAREQSPTCAVADTALDIARKNKNSDIVAYLEPLTGINTSKTHLCPCGEPKMQELYHHYRNGYSSNYSCDGCGKIRSGVRLACTGCQWDLCGGCDGNPQTQIITRYVGLLAIPRATGFVQLRL